jgi:hypothetical protein
MGDVFGEGYLRTCSKNSHSALIEVVMAADCRSNVTCRAEACGAGPRVLPNIVHFGSRRFGSPARDRGNWKSSRRASLLEACRCSSLCCLMSIVAPCPGSAVACYSKFTVVVLRTVPTSEREPCTLGNKFINNAFVVTMGTPRCVVTCAFSRLMTGRLQSHFREMRQRASGLPLRIERLSRR